MASVDRTEIGSTGLHRTGGFVNEEFLPQLYGQKANKVYREMADNEPVIGGILLAFDQVAGKLDWHIEPPEEASKKDLDATDFIRSCWEDMSSTWDTTLSNVMSMCTFGFSFVEVNYKIRKGPDAPIESKFDDGKIGWKSWAIRSQESVYKWDFGDNGSIVSMTQQDPVSGKMLTIPLEKALLFRTSEFKDNPQGRSLLRNSYVPYYYLKRIREYEAIGFERDLAGLPTVNVPAAWMMNSATASQKSFVQSMATMVQEIRRNQREGVVMPVEYDDRGNQVIDFKLMNAGGSSNRAALPDVAITRYKQEIAMSLLADFLTLGHDGVGSFALGTAKIDLWTMVVDSLAKSIAGVVNKHAIEKLLRMNKIPYDKAPTLQYGSVSNIDIRELGFYIQALTAGSLITSDPTLEGWLREAAGMPMAEEGVIENKLAIQNDPPVPTVDPVSSQLMQPDGTPVPVKPVPPTQAVPPVAPVPPTTGPKPGPGKRTVVKPAAPGNSKDEQVASGVPKPKGK